MPKSKRLTLALAGLLLASPSALHAQVVQRDTLLGHLIGRWALRGPMAGKDVVHDVTFRWVLGGEYVEMHEVSRERTAAGAPAYEAIVYLVRDPHTHEYAALWLDNTDYNAFLPAGVGHATAAGDSIPFVFTSSATDHFHNTFVYDRATDTWAWHMDNDDARGRRAFARVTLTRSSAADDLTADDLAAAREALAPKLQEMLAAANAHDTDRHLAAYLHSPDLVFVVNDQTIHGWDALRAQQLKWWQNGKSDAVYTVLGTPEYTMLSPGLVAQTYFLDSHRAGAGDAHGAHIGVTDVWRKQGDTWRIVYAHESVVPR